MFIKVKIKGTLRNTSDLEIVNIDAFGIKNNNNISFNDKGIKYRINIKEKEVRLVRETNEYINSFIFIKDKKTTSEYYIKEYNSNIDVEIITNKLIIQENNLEISYIIKDNNNSYMLTLELREK